MHAMSERASAPQVTFTVYYGVRRFLLLAQSFVLDRAHNPYRRLSATLLIACKHPFRLETGNDKIIETYAALIAPDVPRHRIIAEDSDIAIFDMPIETPEFAALKPLLSQVNVTAFALDRFTTLLPDLRLGFSEHLSHSQVETLFDAAIIALCGHKLKRERLDPRVIKVIELINGLPFDEAPVICLAQRLQISPSRLQHLFKEQLGTTLSHYRRWAAVWRAGWLLSKGCQLTTIAHQIGFYDLAHLDHAFAEIFGLSPSTLINPMQVTLVRCPEPPI